MSDDPHTEIPQPETGGHSTTAVSRSDAAVAVTASSRNAPARITATGRGAMAEKILEIAFANGVKVREDPDLVSFLSTLDVDSDIPLEALAAVADILTYIYRTAGSPEPARSESEASS